MKRKKAPYIPTGVYCQLDDLLNLRQYARPLLYKQMLSFQRQHGMHRSAFKSRGLEFEEVRHYQAGDDVRTIDWRVTARSMKPHTKLFREESERPVNIVIDQSQSMFFGTRQCFKSLLAAHIASLLAWSSLRKGDQVGGIVFNDLTYREHKNQRSKKTVLQLLNTIVDYTNKLPLNIQSDTVVQTLSQIVHKLRLSSHGSSEIIIISDFYDVDSTLLTDLRALAKHHRVSCIHIADTFEKQLPALGRIALVAQNTPINIDSDSNILRERYAEYYQQRIDTIRTHCKNYAIHFSSIDSDNFSLTDLYQYIAA